MSRLYRTSRRLFSVALLFPILLAPAAKAGGVESEGGIVTQATRLRQLVAGNDGTGIRIGVVSNSYNRLGGAAADVASGDLPANVTVLSEGPLGGTDEGRAMLQVIHDLAPGATLGFAAAGTSEATAAQAIRDLANTFQADVIVDSMSFPREPFFQDGLIAQAIDDVVQNSGVAYFSAAGNLYQQAFELTSAPSTGPTSFGANIFGIPSFALSGALDLDPGAGTDFRQSITLNSNQTVTLVLQWNDPFFASVGTDLDLYLVDPATNELVAFGAAAISNGPVETISYTNTSGAPKTYEIIIDRFAGPIPSRIKWVNYGASTSGPISNVEYATNSSTILPHAASANAMAVGTVNYFDQRTAATYTSRGPATILFSAAGTPISPVVRAKPDLAGVDGVNNTFFGNDAEGDGRPNFFGTSAAAAHAAAVGALVLQANPTLQPAQLYARLKASAVDLGAAGADSITGSGLVNAFTAVEGAATPASLPVAENFDSGLNARWEVNSRNNGRVVFQSLVGESNRRMLMDTFFGANNSLNEAVLHFDATSAGSNEIELAFAQREFGDEDNPMPATFTGSSNSDGVALSVDGVNWYRLVSLTGANSPNTFRVSKFNLTQFARDNGLVLGSDVRVKFQQYDNFSIDSDGMAFDDVAVSVLPAAPQITMDTMDGTFTDGQPASFSFTATGHPPFTVRWQVSTDGGVSFQDISGATSTTLTFNATLADNGKKYRAVLTNSEGSVNTAIATLTVTENPSLTVTTTSDVVNNSDGQTSLREAIAYLNTGNAGVNPVITFAPALKGGLIRLASALPQITRVVTIDGDIDGDTVPDLTITGDVNDDDTPVTGSTTITDIAASQAAGKLTDNVRIFDATVDLTIDGLVLTGGVTTVNGGGILSSGSVTVSHSIISGNSAESYGGGIHTDSPATVSNSRFNGNSAAYGGGMSASLSVVVSESTFSGNSANAGGGIYTTNTLTARNSTFSGNSAASFGGGILAALRSIVSNSTFSGNSANLGGGIYANSTATVTNSTFSGNSANLGGGIYAISTATVSNSTFSGNSANLGGGIYANSNATVINSIVLGNSAPNSADIFGTVTARGLNLIGVGSDTDSSDGVINASSLDAVFASVSANPFTNVSSGTLADNGGPTQTIALNAGSLAIDAASDVGALGSAGVDGTATSLSVVDATFFPAGVTIRIGDEQMLVTAVNGTTLTVDRGVNQTTASAHPAGAPVNHATDQRGQARVRGGTVDIGAFESAPSRLYIDQSVTGGDGNGDSWVNAMPELRTATAVARTDPNVSEIWVARGIYKPAAANSGDRAATFRLRSGLAIYGGFSGSETESGQRDGNPATNDTVLNGDLNGNDAGPATKDNVTRSDNSYHVVTGSQTDATALLDGFTVSGGNANGNSPDFDGGGLYLDSGSPTLANLAFTDSSASGFGGGIYIKGGNPSLTRVTLRGNSASSGGGIYNDSSNSMLSEMTFQDNSVTVNGGGLCIDSSSPTLVNVTFFGNSAAAGGGISNLRGSNPVLSHVIFRENSGGGGGGGMRNAGNSNPTLTNVTFTGNWANLGGGLFNLDRSSPTLANVVFSGNSAVAYGGGVYNHFRSSPMLTNVTFSGNSATLGGGAIFNRNASADRSDPQLRNCILWGNGTEIVNEPNTSTTVFNSIVRGGYPGATDADPGFITPINPQATPAPTTAGNLRLRAGSPAINAGDNSVVTATTDPDGAVRIIGGTVDLGAYELIAPPTLTETQLSLINGDSLSDLSTLTGADPAGGVFSGTGVSVDGNGKYLFDSTGMALGTQVTITYTISGPGGSSNETTATVTVLETPSLTVTTAIDTSTNTDGQTSLREALAYAQEVGGTPTITFDPTVFATARTITLGSELAVNSHVTITGPGADKLTVSGNHSVRIFTITGGVAVDISGLTLANGRAAQGAGGAVYNDGNNLTLRRCVIRDCFAGTSGGGVATTSSSGRPSALRVIECAVIGNSGHFGGGISCTSNGADSALWVMRSLVARNSARAEVVDPIAGGIYCGDTTSSTFIESSIVGNATEAAAGGISGQATAAITIQNSLVVGNTGKEGASDMSGGTITDKGGNLIGLPGGTTLGQVLQVDGNGRPLTAGNGSSVPTVALVAGSPALDAGANLTTLTTALADGTGTSLTLGDTSGLYAGATIQIDAEQMTVQHVVDATTCTVTRGVNGSSAIAHAADAPVNHATDQRGSGFPRIQKGLASSPAARPDIGAYELFAAPTLATDALTIVSGSGTLDLAALTGAAPSGGAFSGTGVNSGIFDPSGVAPGPHIVTYTVNDGFGASNRATFTVTVFEAPSLTVTTTTDITSNIDGLTSLREAIGYAKTLGGARTIRFNGDPAALPKATGTGIVDFHDGAVHTLEARSALLINNQILTVNGTSADRLILRNLGNVGTLLGIFNASTVELSGMTVTGAASSGINSQNSNLILRACVVSGNATDSDSTNGGGIYNVGGDLTLVDSTVSDNAVQGFNRFGGGIYHNGGTAILKNSTVSGNSLNGTANNYGAGIYNEIGGTLILMNSTVSGNSSNNGSNVGGAIYSVGTLELTNCTVTDNSASGGADILGGIANIGTAHVRNSIISGNTGGTTPDLVGSPATDSNNLIGDQPDLRLAPLGDYGGPTLTHALLPGSSAIDAGDNTLAVDENAVPLTSDQRGLGFARIAKGSRGSAAATADIGAFELFAAPEFLTDEIRIQIDGNPLDLVTATGVSPRGGVFSGPGVRAGVFDPRTRQAGRYEITYTLTGDFGLINRSTLVIVVIADGPRLELKRPRPFAITNVGRRSKVQRLSLANRGDQPATGLRVVLRGAGRRDFRVTQPAASALSPKATTTFRATFHPKQAGTRTAKVTIVSRGGKPVSATLRGKGRKTSTSLRDPGRVFPGA